MCGNEGLSWSRVFMNSPHHFRKKSCTNGEPSPASIGLHLIEHSRGRFKRQQEMKVFQSTIENRKLEILIGAFSLLIFLSGCNHGLAPLPVQPGFGGTIKFVSTWPPQDSVYDIRVVAFYDYPPTNIIGEVESGSARVYPAISANPWPLFVNSLAYSFSLDSSSTFQYVAVALRYGANIFADWKVVGAYGYSHGVGEPKTVVIPPNTIINNIDIEVDFKNIPPTPLSASVVSK